MILSLPFSYERTPFRIEISENQSEKDCNSLGKVEFDFKIANDTLYQEIYVYLVIWTRARSASAKTSFKLLHLFNLYYTKTQ